MICDHVYTDKYSFNGQRTCDKCGRYEIREVEQIEPLSREKTIYKVCLDLIGVARRRGTEIEALLCIEKLLEQELGL